MAGKKGRSGRPVGTYNKPRDALLRMLNKTYPGYHPVLEMARIAHETDDIQLEAQMHKEIAQYVEPKLKAVEIKGEVNHTVDRSRAEADLIRYGINPEDIVARVNH